MTPDDIKSAIDNIRQKLNLRVDQLKDQFTGLSNLNENAREKLGMILDMMEEEQVSIKWLTDTCESLMNSHVNCLTTIETLARIVAKHELFLKKKHPWAYPRFKGK